MSKIINPQLHEYEIKLGSKWIDVPYWARWVAQDYNGVWTFFTHKPKRMDGYWYLYYDLGRDCKEVNTGKIIPPKDFTKEVYQIQF